MKYDQYDIVIEGRMPPGTVSLEEYVSSKTGIANPSDMYLFELMLDADRIKLPSNPLTIQTGDTYPHILPLIIGGYKCIGSMAEIEEKLDILRSFLAIPIVILGYHKANIGMALEGNTVDPIVFVYHDGTTALIEEINARSESLVNAFVDSVWGVIRKREGGRFAPGSIRASVRPGDSIVGINGFAIRIAPSGQIRMRNGSLGPKIIGSSLKSRKDGSIWFKTNKNKWRKWK